MGKAAAMMQTSGSSTMSSGQSARNASAAAALAILCAIATFAPQASAATPLGGATQVTAGDRHACALLSAGGVKCWGDNHWGKLGNGTTTASSYAVDVQGVANAVDVAAGHDYGCAVTADGGVKCWGREPQRNHGFGSSSDVFPLFDVAGLAGMTALKLAAGTNHACAIVDTGTVAGAVYCWGSNEYGQLGNGAFSLDELVPVPAAGIAGATAIAAGESHTCAIVAAGAVKCWGSDANGELGDGRGLASVPPGASSALPVLVPLAGPATSIAAGDYHACALLASGEVACWGGNYYGQVGTLPLGPDTYAVPSIATTGATAVGAGGADSCAVIGDGTVKCWGASNTAASGLEAPTTVAGLSGASRVAVGGSFGGAWNSATRCALVGSGVQCWGVNESGQLGNGVFTGTSSPVDVVGITDAVDISAGGGHTCAARALPLGVRSVECWGWNSFGQLGDGTFSSSSVPVRVYDFGGTQVAAGDSHTCAVRDANVACWGNNIYGQLGHPPAYDTPGLIDPTKPANVPLPAVAIQVVVGWAHSCALMADRTVSCWGWNHWGQLGLGDASNRDSPAQVPGLAGVDEIAAGAAHTCARIGGAVKCWGSNYYGQLGNGGQAEVNVSPLDVSGLTSATQITAGSYHTCARLSDGTARCWGENGFGQLGNGSQTGSKVPVEVSSSGTLQIVQIAAGGGWTCARVAGNQAFCWGGNQDGQLGNPNVVDRYRTEPVLVAGLTDVVKVSAGGAQVCAITGSGIAKCWGRGENGELGDGRTGLYGLPATVLLAPSAGATTTTLAAAPGASSWGQPVTLTATVFSGNTPTGTVEFSANGSPIAACASVTLAGSQAQCTTSALPIGTNALAAAYGGDAANSASTGTLSFEVTRAAVSMTITAHTPDPSAVLSPVKVTVALGAAPGIGIPSGTVQVNRSGDQCTISVPAPDPSCTLTPILVGTVVISAQYGGDSNFAPAAAPAVAHTTTALAQTITFPAIPGRAMGTAPFIVSASASSGLAVAFASTTLLVCTVSGNVVTLVGAGTCTIAADQPGSAIYGAAPQVVQSFTVFRTNAMLLKLSSSASPSTFGQSVTFTFVALGDVGTPVGTVAFSDGGTPICSAVVLDAGGSASCTTSSLAAGTHTIAADYSGDAKYLPGTATLVQNVVAPPPVASAIADVDYPSALDTEVRALNDNGQLTGMATLVGAPMPFAYTAGAYAPLPALPPATGLAVASPHGIDGSGKIVGGAVDAAAVPTSGKGFVLVAGAYSLLSHGGFPITEFRGVNAAGTIAGWAYNPAGPTSVAFVYDPATSTYTDITIPVSGWRQVAHAINVAGVVVGSVDDGATAHGFVRDALGTVTTFQLSGQPTYARGINDAGVIAGYVIAGGVAQGFVGNSGIGFAPVTVPGAVETVALAINNSGQVAGYWVDAQGHRHGFIATPAVLPVGTTTVGGFVFDVAVVGGQPVFIDPAVAVGYDYATGAGDPLFQSVRLPIGFGDSLYTVTAGGASAIVPGGRRHDLRSAANPAGVPAFRVTGIEPTAYVDPKDPRGFPTEVTFAASGRFTGTQTPIVGNVRWPTTMMVASSVNPASAGQWLTLMAQVASPGGTPTGTVTFAEGKRTLCTAELAAGRAQCEVHPLSVGVHKIIASYAGDADYAAVAQTLTLTVQAPAGGKTPQTITFLPLWDRSVASPPFVVSATASSGLPVAFASATPGVCRLTGAIATLTGAAGTCSITATQDGDASYAAAAPVTRSFEAAWPARAAGPSAGTGR